MSTSTSEVPTISRKSNSPPSTRGAAWHGAFVQLQEGRPAEALALLQRCRTAYAARAMAGEEGGTLLLAAFSIGGDRLALWSHPAEVVVEFADRSGLSADSIAEIWPLKFVSSKQSVGQQIPEPPAGPAAVTEA